MRKRLLSALLCLCMLVSMCPTGFAEETETPEDILEEVSEEEVLLEEEALSSPDGMADSGEMGDALSWTLTEDGILTVSGTGEIPNYEDGAAPWNAWTDTILSVMIGEDVTGIGSYAFSGCSKMDSIWMGQSVLRIGEGAFLDCSALTEVLLPEEISWIAARTFENCAALQSISIPDGVLSIGSSAFEGCVQLAEVTVPEKVSAIENSTFQGCTGLLRVTLPSGITKIGDKAFEGCNALGKITLPETVESIGASSFQNCGGLKELSLPQGLSSIGDRAFQGCEGLKGIALPDGISQIPKGAFAGCRSLSQVTLPKGLASLGEDAFLGCEGLTQMVLPDNVTQIGGSAFYGCTNLEQVTLPKGLERIEETVFSGCGALGKLVLPETVTAIGYQAFYHCGSLKIETFPKALQSIGEDAFAGCGDFDFIDLSKLPRTVDRETDLSDMVVLPEALEGKAVTWGIETVPEQKEGRRLAQIRQENGKAILEPLSSGVLRLMCVEPVTGIRNSREVQVILGLEILPAEKISLVSGEKQQFTLIESASGEEREAAWSLKEEDAQAAEITQDGLLTAKSIEKQVQVTVIAALPSGDTAEKTITVLPKATAAELLLDGNPTGDTLKVDMAQGTSLCLSVKIQPEDARTEVQWRSDDEQTAYVEAGTVTLRKPGTVTIWAGCTDGSNVVGKTELQIRYVDAAPQLTLTTDGETLEPGETVRLVLAGEAPIDPEKVLFSLSDVEMATVDAQGNLTAGDTPGTVTVTAQIKDDPLLRTAQRELKIQEGEIKTLRLTPVFPDDRGYLAEKAYVESRKLGGKAYSFRVTVQGSTGGDRWQEMTGVTYRSTNTALAKVTADGRVTVQAKKEGSCQLTARTADGLEAQLELQVWDSAPRLGSSTLTMNGYKTAPVSTSLVEVYENAIQKVSVYSYDAPKKSYQTEPSQVFDVTFTEGLLELEARETLKNGTYPLKLRVQTTNTTFDYTMQIKVANSLPKVNVKQREKLNLFYLDTQARLSVSAAGSKVRDVELIGANTFRLEEDGQEWRLCYGEDYAPGTKANLKGTLQIYLEGYRVPVKKAITIAASNTAPKLTLDPGSSVIHPAQELVSRARVYRGGQMLDLTDAEIESSSGIAEVTAWGEELRFLMTGTKGGTVNFTLRLPNWNQPVKLSRKITVENKLPTLKLRSGTLKLNRRFPWQEAGTTGYLTQSNQTLGGMRFVSTAKEGTAQRKESDKIALSYDPSGHIRVAFLDQEDLPKNGTYPFACRASLADGTELPAATLKITVADTAPKAKLSTGSVRLNRYLAGAEEAQVAVTLSSSAYRIVGFRELDGYEELSYGDGKLTVRLTEASKNTVIYLTPIVEDVENGYTAALSTRLKLGLTVYNSAKLGVSLSAKGKLDTLAPDKGITYTVSKLTNCQGTIENMKLEGPDADEFQAELDTTGAKPVVKLRLLEEETYDTRKTYQVRFRLTVCDQEVLLPMQKLRVTQSALKVTVPKTLTVYLGQKAPVRCTLTPSAPVEKIALSGKTDKTFLGALGDTENFEVSGNQVLFRMTSPGKLKAGKSYTVYLDLTPIHNAGNVKPTQVKLTVKAVK